MQPPATGISVPTTTTVIHAQNGCCTVPPNVSGHVRGVSQSERLCGLVAVCVAPR
ncbi:unnamed protein product [Ectocarpus sp. CCAP 1310/34]|nr:unnamed protein product [Ectocarpus sp. CCAP 1310/34]